MTAHEIREICIKKQISFIPHHACACCGSYTGWYLFGRWPGMEVAYSSACDCSYYDHATPSHWGEIAEWVNDKDGNLRGEYKNLFEL